MLNADAKIVSNSPRESGFTLIEILVAVLVLSLGVLGLIGMESLALKNNHSAYQRTQATLLSYDLMDRIRANRANVEDYDIDETPDSGSMVEEDLNEWKARLQKLLPGSRNDRQYDAANHTFDVTISWGDNREKLSNPDTTFRNTFRP